MSNATTRLVALFGTFTLAQLQKLAAAQWVALSTDHPTEAGLYSLAKEAGLKIIRRGAAWGILDHPLSVTATRLNRQTGAPEEYNANGGYVRDALLIEDVHAVIVGPDIRGKRLELIQATAAAAGRPLRQLVETIEPVVVDPAVVAAELAALDLDGTTPAQPKPRRGRKPADAPTTSGDLPY